MPRLVIISAWKLMSLPTAAVSADRFLCIFERPIREGHCHSSPETELRKTKSHKKRLRVYIKSCLLYQERERERLTDCLLVSLSPARIVRYQCMLAT
jgi:hypothetical protein